MNVITDSIDEIRKMKFRKVFSHYFIFLSSFYKD